MEKKNVPKTTSLKKQIIDFLIQMPLFNQLDSNELTLIADHMNFFEIKKNEILFREGDKGDYVCFIVDGQLEVIKEAATGLGKVIATLPAGRTIGEMSIIDHTPRSATVRACTDTTLVALTGKGFDLILEHHPRIGIKILKGLARLLSMNMRKTSSRLADTL